LRQALIDANGNPGVDIIQIDPSINGSIVTIGSTLPALTENVVLDGPTASTLTVRFVSLSSMFTGAFGFDKQNAGTLIFDGRNDYTGGTTVSGGTLQGDSFSLTGDIVNNSAVNFFQQSGDGTYAGNMSGTGALVKTGGWKLTMTGTNTYSGGTTISAGLLEGDTVSLPGNIVDNSALIFNQAGAGTFAGIISGTGSVTKLGGGTLTMTGANTYTGSTIVSGGVLQGNTTSLPGNIVNGSSVVFDQNFDGTYAGDINFSGSVTKQGTGNVTFSGNNTYTGATTVSAGKLTVTGSVSGATTVQAGAALGGSGQVGDLTNSGTVAPGTSIGTLTVNGDYIHNAGANYDLEINDANQHDLLTATGTATLNGGTVNVIGAPGTYSAATYTILSAAGGVTGTFNSIIDNLPFVDTQLVYNANDVQLTLTPVGGTPYTVVNTNDSGPGSLRQAIIDANGNAGVDTIQIDPSLNGATINLASSLPALTENIVFNGPSASSLTVRFVSVNDMFSGGFGMVKANAGTLIFDGKNSYTGGTTVAAGALQGDSFSLTGDFLNNSVLIFDQATADGVYTGNISGTGALVKTGGWKLTMTGTNSYTGGTTVSGGILEGDTDSLQGNILNNSAVIFDQAVNGTYAGNMSGTGSLTKVGAGSLILTGNNTYTGATIVSGGTLQGNSSSLPGDIVNGGVVIFDQGFNGTFAGDINFTGSVIKQGAGTLTMTGTNSYTGGTTVSQGVLRGNTASLQGAITNNAAVVFDQASNGTYAGVMSGPGALTKTGAGNLTLSGNNTYTGLTTVAAGQLAVGGQIAGSADVQYGGTLAVSGQVGGNVAIQNGGSLVNNGQVAGTVDVLPGGVASGSGQVGGITNSGRIAPGNSIGTMTINGNYTHNAGATYDVEINPVGQSDRIDVTGTATLNGGTVNVIGEPGEYQTGTTYTILTAAGGVTGAFASVLDNMVFVDTQLVYNPNDVQLVLFRNSTSYDFVGATANQRAVAAELQALSTSASGDFAQVVAQIQTLTALGAQTAFDQMTGEIYGSIAAAEMANTTHYLTMISDRARYIQNARYDQPTLLAQATPSPTPNQSSPIQQVSYVQESPSPAWSADGGCVDCCGIGWDGWIVGYGMEGGIGSDGNATGLDYSFWGTTLGVDRVVDGTMVGAAFGYTPFDADRNAGVDHIEAENYHFSLYGSTNFESSYALGVVSYGHSDYDATRRIAFGGINRVAEADFDSDEFSAYAEAGLYRYVGQVVVQPLAGVQFINLDRDGFRETGAGDLNLALGRTSSNSLRGVLGARIARPFLTHSCHTIVPEIRARWMHEFLDEQEIISPRFVGLDGGSFAISGLDSDRDFLILGTGVTAGLTNHFSVFANYDTQISESETAHGGNGGLQFIW
jgi:outer membrane autotransporter protein